MPYYRTYLRGTKTTLILPDPLMVALTRRAAERGTSLSALATELLQRGLDEPRRAEPGYEPNFPVFDMGRALVDSSDWNAVRETLDEEKDRRLYPWLFGAVADEPSPPDR